MSTERRMLPIEKPAWQERELLSLALDQASAWGAPSSWLRVWTFQGTQQNQEITVGAYFNGSSWFYASVEVLDLWLKSSALLCNLRVDQWCIAWLQAPSEDEMKEALSIEGDTCIVAHVKPEEPLPDQISTHFVIQKAPVSLRSYPREI